MAKWTRLTPGTEDENGIVLVRQARDGPVIVHGYQEDGECQRSVFSNGKYLTDAEALAFARQVDEVRALVAAAQAAEAAMRENYTGHRGLALNELDPAKQLVLALAPFEESTDAT